MLEFVGEASVPSTFLQKCKHFAYGFAEEVRRLNFGAVTPGYDFMKTLREGIESILPSDVHEIAENRLYVSVTNSKSGENHLVSSFPSREDLIKVLLASSFIPVYAGIKPVEFKGQKWVDGGLTNGLPILPVGRTVTISPFSGRLDICPEDKGRVDLYVKLAKQDMMLSLANLVRLNQALFPPDQEKMELLYQNGFDDAVLKTGLKLTYAYESIFVYGRNGSGRREEGEGEGEEEETEHYKGSLQTKAILKNYGHETPFLPWLQSLDGQCLGYPVTSTYLQLDLGFLEILVRIHLHLLQVWKEGSKQNEKEHVDKEEEKMQDGTSDFENLETFPELDSRIFNKQKISQQCLTNATNTFEKLYEAGNAVDQHALEEVTLKNLPNHLPSNQSLNIDDPDNLGLELAAAHCSGLKPSLLGTCTAISTFKPAPKVEDRNRLPGVYKRGPSGLRASPPQRGGELGLNYDILLLVTRSCDSYNKSGFLREMETDLTDIRVISLLWTAAEMAGSLNPAMTDSISVDLTGTRGTSTYLSKSEEIIIPHALNYTQNPPANVITYPLMVSGQIKEQWRIMSCNESSMAEANEYILLSENKFMTIIFLLHKVDAIFLSEKNRSVRFKEQFFSAVIETLNTKKGFGRRFEIFGSFTWMWCLHDIEKISQKQLLCTVIKSRKFAADSWYMFPSAMTPYACKTWELTMMIVLEGDTTRITAKKERSQYRMIAGLQQPPCTPQVVSMFSLIMQTFWAVSQFIYFYSTLRDRYKLLSAHSHRAGCMSELRRFNSAARCIPILHGFTPFCFN
ncbi:hypothetical protein IHE44_0005099 [Lamprotornis superbus]|uniref:PNPLA domain-containing protein n=1 Tax=Lamprotornis superbus TaxID=245042 RepID=A0A835TV93_9PASS|nr:hypothetical protein IHE44_0005099 [Lamprotornis superbus]